LPQPGKSAGGGGKPVYEHLFCRGTLTKEKLRFRGTKKGKGDNPKKRRGGNSEKVGGGQKSITQMF